MDVSYELKRKRDSDLSTGSDENNEMLQLGETEPSCKRQQITRKFQSTRRHDSIPNIVQLSKHIARVSFLIQMNINNLILFLVRNLPEGKLLPIRKMLSLCIILIFF